MAILEETSAPSASVSVERMLERIRPAACGILRRYRIPSADLDDILQDTLLVWVAKRTRLESPEGWILATLRNRCLMYWRERQRIRRTLVDAPRLDLAADPRLSTPERSALLLDLERVLHRLPLRQRHVIEARYLEDLSPAETARRFGYRESGIYKITARAKQAFARELAREGYRNDREWTA